MLKNYAIKQLKKITEMPQSGTRDGIEIIKGVSVSEDKLISLEPLLQKYLNLFTAYPDIYVDKILRPAASNFSLFFYQVIFLRACLRYRYVYVVACRAFSKTFISVLALILECIFRPGAKIFMASPTKDQAVKVCGAKIKEILELFPLLRRELVGGDGNFSAAYCRLTFRNGSMLEVMAPLDSSRGLRKVAGLIDEVRDHDANDLNEIVIPTLNVARRTSNGSVNPYEPNSQQLYMTSAASKITYAYSKALEIFEMSIIQPKTAFFMSCDYRVPMMHGLLDRRLINELKLSPTFDSESFAREYLSQWTGGNDESWFNFDAIQKYRVRKNPEWRQKNGGGVDQFYLLSIDIGRLNDSSVVCVFRVNVSQGQYRATLVNLYVLGLTDETKIFSRQVIDIKHLIENYSPREVIIDTNGIGLAIGDEMVRQQIDENGNVLPAYGFINDDNYKKIQPKDAPKILYGIKANASLNSKIFGNCYTRTNNGLVRFLIREQEAKTALMATKSGQRMSTEQRVRRLMPHTLTTALFDEMANLRLKRTGSSTDIVLERINTRYPKDKFIAFAYGLWRIKLLEEENAQKNRRVPSAERKLVFFSGGI